MSRHHRRKRTAGSRSDLGNLVFESVGKVDLRAHLGAVDRTADRLRPSRRGRECAGGPSAEPATLCPPQRLHIPLCLRELDPANGTQQRYSAPTNPYRRGRLHRSPWRRQPGIHPCPAIRRTGSCSHIHNSNWKIRGLNRNGCNPGHKADCPACILAIDGIGRQFRFHYRRLIYQEICLARCWSRSIMRTWLKICNLPGPDHVWLSLWAFQEPKA